MAALHWDAGSASYPMLKAGELPGWGEQICAQHAAGEPTILPQSSYTPQNPLGVPHRPFTLLSAPRAFSAKVRGRTAAGVTATSQGARRSWSSLQLPDSNALPAAVSSRLWPCRRLAGSPPVAAGTSVEFLIISKQHCILSISKQQHCALKPTAKAAPSLGQRWEGAGLEKYGWQVTCLKAESWGWGFGRCWNPPCKPWAASTRVNCWARVFGCAVWGGGRDEKGGVGGSEGL